MQYLYGHANKAFVVGGGGVVVVACQKQKKSVEGGKEYNVLSEYEYSTGCPNWIWRGLQVGVVPRLGGVTRMSI